MSIRIQGARARFASGRFLCFLTIALAGCQTVGGVRGPVDPAGDLPVVVVEPGTVTGADQSEARTLLESAQRSFAARRYFEVLRTTDDILSNYAASEASGEALRLTAQAALEVGELARADEAAALYLSLLAPDDPRRADMMLVQASAAVSDPATRIERLLAIDAGADPEVVDAGAIQLREAADSLGAAGLQELVDGVTTRGPLVPVAEARLSVLLLERGRTDEAVIYARRALDEGVSGEDRTWAEGVVAGDLPPDRQRTTAFRIAVVLPMGGPPAMAEFSREISQGIEVAAATVLGEEYTITVEVRDDEGDPALTAQHVAELEAEGVDAIVGMLQDDVLVTGAGARALGVPIISPTARSAAQAGEGVYSLDGADPSAAASIAAYAASRAFQRVAMVYPHTPDAEAEANAFAAAAGQLGMPVVARFTYEPGASFFEQQIVGARDALRRAEIAALGLTEDDTLHVELLEPVAVFMPIPPEDVEFLAPQVVHFGLDTLAIEVLGTSGWTDPQTLAAVEPRLTNGVVATSPVANEASNEGRERFRQADEEYFQRSLVGGTAAVGYDAMKLLLEALRRGRVDPVELRASFDMLESVPGATGVFSVVDGIVVRATEVVRIENRRLVPVVVAPVADTGSMPGRSR